MEIKINGTPKEIADLALELQNRLMLNLECDSHELAKQTAKCFRTIETKQQDPKEVLGNELSERILIDRIKEILFEHEKELKERFSELLQEHDFSIPKEYNFFYKYSAETIIKSILKSLRREIWKI